jgi:ribosome maturation factor RimP
VADELGFELVEVSLLGRGKRSLLRVIIDREGGNRQSLSFQDEAPACIVIAAL